MDTEMSRRRLLIAGGAAAVAVALGACSGGNDDDEASAPGRATALEETPECLDADDVRATPEQTEGPYFTPDSPQRADIAQGVRGTPLVITGTIVSTDCTPHANALLDVWQCDDDGEYDNEGYILRGHQFAGADGSFRLETIMPGLYPGRTRHIHVKVQPKGGRVLTTQLYFPGVAENASDGIYRKECELSMTDTSNGTFQFVIA